MTEHVVNYSELNECSQTEIRPAGPEPKFRDTINPLLKFSNADLAAMNQEFDQFFESDSSSDDEPGDIGNLKFLIKFKFLTLACLENPPIDRKLKKKRKQEDEKEEVQSKKFFKSEQEEVSFSLQQSSAKRTTDSSSNEDEDAEEDDEMPSTKFRRGENLPSDLDIGSGSDDNSGNSDNANDEMDDGEWNMMGAALEREFLGLE